MPRQDAILAFQDRVPKAKLCKMTLSKTAFLRLLVPLEGSPSRFRLHAASLLLEQQTTNDERRTFPPEESLDESLQIYHSCSFPLY